MRLWQPKARMCTERPFIDGPVKVHNTSCPSFDENPKEAGASCPGHWIVSTAAHFNVGKRPAGIGKPCQRNRLLAAWICSLPGPWGLSCLFFTASRHHHIPTVRNEREPAQATTETRDDRYRESHNAATRALCHDAAF